MGNRLGILAGGGVLPAKLVKACQATGRPFFVVAFEGQTDPATVEGIEHCWLRLGQAGAAIKALRQAGVNELVMIGPVARPSLSDLQLDFRGMQFFAKVGTKSLGDDGLLSAIVATLEKEGFRVIGVEDVVKELLAPPGPFGSRAPDAQAERDIARGLEVARALGAVDIGQAVVVQEGVVLGVEAIEGTDRLLARCGELRRSGPGGVLVKVRKPGQDTRVDLPTIGLRTIERAAAAGLRGVAVEAGGALVVERDAVIAAAEAAGLFVVGVTIEAD